MMNLLKTEIKTALILAKERIYQGQRKQSLNLKEKKKNMRKTLLFTNLGFLPMYILISIFLGTTKAGINSTSGLFSILFIMQIMISFLLTLTSMSTFKDLGLLKPLFPLPINIKYPTISLSWFFSGGIPITIIPIPAAIIYSLRTGRIFPIPMSIIWSFLNILIGHSIGLMLSNTFSFSIAGKSKKSKIIRVLKIFIGLGFMLIWYVISYQENLLNTLYGPLQEIGFKYWFLYPFTASNSISYFSLQYLVLTLLYSGLFLLIYSHIGKTTWQKLKEPVYNSNQKEKKLNLNYRSKYFSEIRKNLLVAFRTGNIIKILIFPLIILVPRIINALQNPNIGIIEAELIYLLTSMISAMGVTYFYIQEGKSAWIISALPIKRMEFAFQKAISTFLLFIFYMTPIILFISYKAGFSLIITISQLFSSFILCFNSCLVMSKFLMDKIPREINVISQESFGTQFTPFIILIKSSIITVWTLIPIFLAKTFENRLIPFQKPLIILITILTLNVINTILIMHKFYFKINILNKTKKIIKKP